jgi:hypothetical protein
MGLNRSLLVWVCVVGFTGKFTHACLRDRTFSRCRDDNCNSPWSGYGGQQAWYPGASQIDAAFREQVGSYMCEQTNVLEGCPGLSGANTTSAANVARATSQYTA